MYLKIEYKDQKKKLAFKENLKTIEVLKNLIEEIFLLQKESYIM